MSGNKIIDIKADDKFLQEPIKLQKIKITHYGKDKQSDNDSEYVRERNAELHEMKEERDRGQKQFGSSESGHNLTLQQYVAQGEDRLNGIAYRSEYKDDWQANVFDHITRNKVFAILARLAATRMQAHFFNTEGLSDNLARIVSNLYDLAGRGKNGKGKDEEFQFLSMYEAISKGTVVREEDYFDGKRRVKTTQKKNKTWNYKTVYEWEDVMSRVIPLESFIPGDLSKRSVQEMGKAAIELLPSLETFRIEYADFKNIHKVLPLSEYKQEELTYFNLPHGKGDYVLVRKYWNRNTDTYDVIANEILLTVRENALTKTYAHRQIPLNSFIFEMLGTNFFYGMSLPFKLASFQDISNSLWNMILDQMFIALKTPIFNASGSDIDLDWISPSNVIDLDAGADLNSIREFKVAPQTNYGIGVLNTLHQRLNETSAIGHEQAGVAGAGRGRTAEEVATAREAGLEVMGLFLRMAEWAEEHRAEQRVQNMLQHYSKRKKGDGRYRKFVIENARLLNNELGQLEVNIRKEPRSAKVLNKLNLQTEETSQILDVKPEIIRNFKGLMKIIPNSSVKETEDNKKREEIAWQKLTAGNPYVNQKENIRQLAEIFNKNPARILNSEPSPEAVGPDQAKATNRLDYNNLKREVSKIEQLPKKEQ